MSRAWGIMAAVCIVVGGCATPQAESPTFNPTNTTSGSESNERARARIHTELAAGYYEIGNIGVALESVQEALRADSNYGPAYNVAGLIYARLRDDRLAEENFQRALRINPNDHDALNNYGSFLCERKQEKAAIKLFIAAVRNPLYAHPDRSFVNAGACARNSGDLAAAEGYFQQALSFNQNQAQALYGLADMFYARGDHAAAKGYIARLAKLVVPNAEMLWLAVRVERKLGDRDSEASYASQLRNRFPESPETRLLRAGKFE